MLNQKTGNRELAYIVEIAETRKLDGYDNVHYVKINEWWCVAKNTLNVGDKAIYFEIDSLLPSSDSRFSFMEKKKYRVKTIRICGTISQGLVLPLIDFPEFKNAKVGDFVTDKLGVKLYESDGLQKPQPQSKSDAFTKAMDRHRNFFKNPVIQFFMKWSWFRFLMKKIFIHKKDKISWPVWLPKTGAERIQNMPQLFETSTVTEIVGENEVNIPQKKSETFIIEEKVDGCSSSYILDEKDTYMVGSHNIIVYSSKVKDSEKIADGNKYIKTNIWIEMSDKYDFCNKLKQLKQIFKLKTVAIQGEVYGSCVQKRTYSKKHDAHDFVVFHVWFDGEILPVKRMIEVCEDLSLPHVHVFDWNYQIPNSVEEIEKDIDSRKSNIDGGDIEGFVFYTQDGQQHFKCVSPNYLMKYHS